MRIIPPHRNELVTDKDGKISFRYIRFLESLAFKVNDLCDRVTDLEATAQTGKLLLQDGFAILHQNGTDSLLQQGGA